MRHATTIARQLVRKAFQHGPRWLLDWKDARYFRRHGEIELCLVPQLCRRDCDAIDVGAHEGMYILFMRRHARRILAFEPLPDLHDKLCRRFADAKVTVLNIALSDRLGVATLHVPLKGSDAICGLSTLNEAVAAAHPKCVKISVPTMPLDEMYNGPLGFMKIDVEGHEEAVLDGARATLTLCRPRLLIESDDNMVPGSRQRIVDRMGAMNYAAFFVRDRTLHAIGDFVQAIDQQPLRWPGLGDGKHRRHAGYVSNFVFIPCEDVHALVPTLEAALALS